MRITVILCTHNRCGRLATALESVAASALPDSIEWEVLVVDNNSRDQTREVVESFCRRYSGRFQYLFEPQPGKSYALNSGVREARGEILAFMDDDVTVEPAWLQSLTANLHDGEWVGAGGRILPEKPFALPRWLPMDGPHALGGILALFEQGDTPGKLEQPPFGTNMAFHKKMFEKYGGFRTDLGPTPGSEIRNEDTEFGRRVMEAGERLRYEPSAVVYHEVPQHRLRKEYFLRWRFDYGRAQIRVKAKRPDVWGIPRHYISISNRLLHILPREAMRWMLTSDPRERFFNKGSVFETIGEIVEIYRQVSDPKEANDNSVALPSKMDTSSR
jgi:glycosyltransferase involved in cell wall biosynthesis